MKVINSKSFWECVLKLLLISFLISNLLHAAQDIKPIAPARSIYFPMFDENGRKIYEIFGDSGTFLQNDHLIVCNIVLNCFSSSGYKFLGMSSSSANVFHSKNIVRGDGPVFIDGEKFTAIATKWEFFCNEKKFVANKNVKVIFSENSLGFLEK